MGAPPCLSRLGETGWGFPESSELVFRHSLRNDTKTLAALSSLPRIHEVQFQVMNRQSLHADDSGLTEPPIRFAGDPVPPEKWESGFKDTVIVYPGGVTRIKVPFDSEGRIVWHCHIIEHEDNEMMRPYIVTP